MLIHRRKEEMVDAILGEMKSSLPSCRTRSQRTPGNTSEAALGNIVTFTAVPSESVISLSHCRFMSNQIRQ
jgi:hypothetical protein